MGGREVIGGREVMGGERDGRRGRNGYGDVAANLWMA